MRLHERQEPHETRHGTTWIRSPSHLTTPIRVPKHAAPGVDGETWRDYEVDFERRIDDLHGRIHRGAYRAKPSKRTYIPKADGKLRPLGIAALEDKIVQQAARTVLECIYEQDFLGFSYGFRPGRSAHQAVRAAQGYVQDGLRWVVDVDLEKFFDRVNHDILMSRLARRIKDKRMLRLIRRYLEAGVMAQGVVMGRWEGTPQGGPLSPLLANVLLDEVDKELEKRGHAFVRYADDGNVYVRSERAAKDVMATLKRLYAKLRLKVNETKSRVTRVWNSQYLGYGFWVAKGKAVKHRVGTKALKVMKERVRWITSRNGGRSLEQVAKELRAYLPGWKEYFRLAETPGVFAGVDGWIGRRLRMARLKQWKKGTTIFRELRKAGVGKAAAASVAACHRCWWKMAGTSALNIALPNTYFARLGVPRLAIK